MKWIVLAALAASQVSAWAADEGREFSLIVRDKQVCRCEYNDERGLLGSSEKCFERTDKLEEFDIAVMANRVLATGSETKLSLDDLRQFGAMAYLDYDLVTKIVKSYKSLRVEYIALGTQFKTIDKDGNSVLPFFARVVWESNPRVKGGIQSGMADIEGKIIFPKDGNDYNTSATSIALYDAGEGPMALGALLREVVNPIMAAQVGPIAKVVFGEALGQD